MLLVSVSVRFDWDVCVEVVGFLRTGKCFDGGGGGGGGGGFLKKRFGNDVCDLVGCCCCCCW